MIGDLTLRRAGTDEAFRMAALHARCFSPAWDEAAMTQYAADPDCGVLSPDRRRGIGRALVGRASALLSMGGVKSLFLEVERTNLPALRLYETLGFSEAGRRYSYYGTRRDALILKRETGQSATG